MSMHGPEIVVGAALKDEKVKVEILLEPVPKDVTHIYTRRKTLPQLTGIEWYKADEESEISNMKRQGKPLGKK